MSLDSEQRALGEATLQETFWARMATKSLSRNALQARWFSAAPDPETLTWPTGWVRCAWCKKIAPYGSPDLILVKRKRGTAVMHKKCAHDAELHDWGNAPPMHGAD